MLKIAALVSLVVACYAQPPEPVRPYLPATFYGKYHAWMSTTDRFGHTERTGQGWRAYDASRSAGVRNTTFQVSEYRSESYYKLERYDLGRNFDVYPADVTGKPECSNYAVAGSFPSYWNWVQFATYDGMRRFPYWDNPAELEWWRLEVSGERYELAVFPEDRNKPAVFIRNSDVDNFVISEYYELFDETTPSSIDFEIPLICQQQLKESPQDQSTPIRKTPNRYLRRGFKQRGDFSKSWRSIALHRRNQRLANRLAGRKLRW